jgi:hypothetical protein
MEYSVRDHPPLVLEEETMSRVISDE